MASPRATAVAEASPKAVLFDFGDTLASLRTRGTVLVVHMIRDMLRSLARHGHRVGPVRFSAVVVSQSYRLIKDRREDREQRAEEVIGRVLTRFGIEDRTLPPKLLQMWYDRTLPDFRLHDGVLGALETLQQSGYRMGVISNGIYSTEFVRQVLDRLGLEEFFSVVLISADVGVRKPHPSIFRMACEALGVPPERCVFVGDHRHADISGARRAGMKALLYRPRLAGRLRPARGCGPVLRHFGALPVLVERLLGQEGHGAPGTPLGKGKSDRRQVKVG